MTSSGFEREYADLLEEQRKKGEIVGWSAQQTVRIISPITNNTISQYQVDFRVEHFDGYTEWIETKYGHEDALWQIKRRLMREIYIPMHPLEFFNVARKRSNGKPDYLPRKRAK